MRAKWSSAAICRSRDSHIASRFPLSPYLAGILGEGAGGAVFGALQDVNPDESRLKNAATGAFLGGTLGAATPAIGKPSAKLLMYYVQHLAAKIKVAEDGFQNLSKDELAQALKMLSLEKD